MLARNGSGRMGGAAVPEDGLETLAKLIYGAYAALPEADTVTAEAPEFFRWFHETVMGSTPRSTAASSGARRTGAATR